MEAALCFQDSPCLQAGECQGVEWPLSPSSANSVRDMPVTSPALVKSLQTDLAYSWEISGRAQHSEAEHT